MTSTNPSEPKSAEVAEASEEAVEGVSSWSVAYRQFKKDKVAVFAALSLVGLGLVSVLSPLLANNKPIAVKTKDGWFFPAFKDYLDPNIPIPFIVPTLQRNFSVFSPSYTLNFEQEFEPQSDPRAGAEGTFTLPENKTLAKFTLRVMAGEGDALREVAGDYLGDGRITTPTQAGDPVDLGTVHYTTGAFELTFEEALEGSEPVSVLASVYEVARPRDLMPFPDWEWVCERIDETGEGWYLMPPVPFYYKQNSRGIKMLPGQSMARLEREGSTRPVEVIPRDEWEKVARQSKLDAELGEIRWDDARGWVVSDQARMTVQIPAGFSSRTSLPVSVPGQRLGDFFVVESTSDDEDGFGTYGFASALPAAAFRIDGLEDLSRETQLEVAERWQRLHQLHAGRVLAVEQVEVGGAAALRVTCASPQEARVEALDRWLDANLAEQQRKAGLDPEVMAAFDQLPASLLEGAVEGWVWLDPTRVLSLTLVDVTPEQIASTLSGVAVTLPSGQVTVARETRDDAGLRTHAEPKVVEGETRLRDGDLVTFGQSSVRFVALPEHVLGTDDTGRDVLSRLIHGTVIAGSVGIVSVSIYVFIGIIVGALAGYFRGWVDLVISRLIEIVICFPTFFLIIMVVGFWKPSIYNIMIALGLIRWTGVARLVRGEFLKIMSEDYVNAARALGLPAPRIIFRHILPNAVAPVFVSASFGVAGAILIETSLSFLGFGVTPPTASWGEVLKQGRLYVNENLPHLVWAPGLCIFFTVTMFNLVGEGLRDALDPKLRQ